MKIVIDIPEEEYAKVKDGRASVSMMRDAIRNGALLPKGHGEMVDIQPLMRGLYEEMCMGEVTYTTSEVYKMLEEELSPIIESDKEGAEEKRFERILESASAQVPLRGKREENRPTWQQDREGGAE